MKPLDRITELKQKIEALEKQKRIEIRKHREEEKKKHQHLCYVIGEKVINIFPELAEIAPGKNNKENDERFGWFEAFLQLVASDNKWKEQFLESFPSDTKKDGDA